MTNETAARFPVCDNKFRTHFEGDVNAQSRPGGFTPGQMRRAYLFNPDFTGAGKKIAVICAFDNVAIEENMRTFCNEFSLPMPQMTIHYPFGRTEAADDSWRIESSLDTQWCHVFAPSAQMAVVFSPDSRVDSLLRCAEYASNQLNADVINMSFGKDESANDEQLSAFLAYSNGVFVSSSGDVGGRVSFPSASPHCISVGGTALAVDANGGRIEEIAWQNGGGGASDVFAISAPQGRFYNIYGMSDGKRSTPDVAMNASFVRGVPVYDSESDGWLTLGGTSLACACFSGVCACLCQADESIGTTNDALVYLYERAGTVGYDATRKGFYDVTIGSNGVYKAKTGYDFCTGLGCPNISLLFG